MTRLLSALSIFLGAFLLFQVQPMLARFILPWFGGTPDTWTTCLLFFQASLLAGYLYAHLLVTRVPFARQSLVHGVVLLAAAATLPIAPSPEWQPQPDQSPTLRILWLLAANVGLPYFALSATAPLVQSWVARHAGSRPYRLYALSNLGSLLALLSYPFLIEPVLRLRLQTWIWSAGFALFAILCLATSWSFRQAGGLRMAERLAEPRQPAGPLRSVLWLALSACGSAMLMATTNQLSQDVAVVPLLWIVPLALYLLTFIVCFGREEAYRRGFWTPVFLSFGCASFFALQRGAELHFLWQFGIYCGAMFATCMVCHGELVRLKPPPDELARFYLVLAAGGTLGGFAVAVLAPGLLPLLLEYELSLACCTLLLLFVYYRDRRRQPVAERSRFSWPPLYLLLLTVVAATALVRETVSLRERFGRDAQRTPARVLERSRSFYGTLVVTARTRDGRLRHGLSHGRILHGEQFQDEPLRRLALTYYGPDSGVAFALAQHPRRQAGQSLRIGDVGMGAGTLATYGHVGDQIRFYEINPDVVRMARQHFSYLPDTPAAVEIVTGDGRLCLEREARTGQTNAFDVLVVDAFSGDAVPVHLLTRECFQLYAQHLAPDGILALHVSSRFLNLTPVAAALCRELGLTTYWSDTPAHPAHGTRRAFWVLASRNSAFLAAVAQTPAFHACPDDPNPRHRWTDDYSSILSVLRK